ncbi:sensor histidine kinase [Bordetella sp. 2513F-2]
MRSLLAGMRKLWSSVAFRLTLNYSLLALAAALASLVIFYYQTSHLLTSQFSRQVTITAQRLGAHFERGGLAGLIDEIELELADRVNTDTEMFLLLDGQGRTLAGNIEADATLQAARPGGMRHVVTLRGRQAEGYLEGYLLPGGARLIIGHDLRDLQEVRRFMTQISLAAISATVLLVLLSALFFRRTLQRRVEVIRRTAMQIGEGELTRRIPPHRREDEFALLAHDINGMLDRIERLMNGVRNVSDAVAHHLRTPLTRILVRLRQASGPDATPEALRHCVSTLVAEVEDLAKVSEKLLQIAELESGTRRKRFGPARLDQIARDVADLYEAVAEDRNISLQCLCDRPVTVHGDRDLLAGAIATLVENAIQYAGSGAHVRIEVALRDLNAHVSVTDDGPGIPAEKQARIGERFYRLNHDVPGYGLGLTTVMAIARLHGAVVSLHDARPGLAVRLDFPAGVSGYAKGER